METFGAISSLIHFVTSVRYFVARVRYFVTRVRYFVTRVRYFVTRSRLSFAKTFSLRKASAETKVIQVQHICHIYVYPDVGIRMC